MPTPSMANLTVRYYRPEASSSRRAELPGLGMVPALLALEITIWGPRGPRTRMGIAHRVI